MSSLHIVGKITLFLEEVLLNRKVRIIRNNLSGYLMLMLVQLFFTVPGYSEFKPFWSHLCLSSEIYNKEPSVGNGLPGHHY